MKENEMVMLLLGIGVLAFAVRNRRALSGIPVYYILLASFGVFFTAITATVAEEFFAEETAIHIFLNYTEHICYACSSIMIAIWCRLSSRAEETTK